jgi:hypothetical protein
MNFFRDDLDTNNKYYLLILQYILHPCCLEAKTLQKPASADATAKRATSNYHSPGTVSQVYP